MTSNGKYISQYDRRVELVADVLLHHTEIGEVAAHELAENILRAIDRTPEKTR